MLVEGVLPFESLFSPQLWLKAVMVNVGGAEGWPGVTATFVGKFKGLTHRLPMEVLG